MLTLVEKDLLIKLFYSNNASVLKAFRKFRTTKKMKKDHGPATENELRQLMKWFEKSRKLKESFLQLPFETITRINRTNRVAMERESLTTESTNTV